MNIGVNPLSCVRKILTINMNVEEQAKQKVTEELAGYAPCNNQNNGTVYTPSSRDNFCIDKLQAVLDAAADFEKKSLGAVRNSAGEGIEKYSKYSEHLVFYNKLAKAFDQTEAPLLSRSAIKSLKEKETAFNDEIAKIRDTQQIDLGKVDIGEVLKRLDQNYTQELRRDSSRKAVWLAGEIIVGLGIAWALYSSATPKVITSAVHLVGDCFSYMDNFASRMPSRIVEAGIKYVGLTPLSVEEFTSTMVKLLTDSSLVQGSLLIGANAVLCRLIPGLSMTPSLLGAGGSTAYFGARQLGLSLAKAYATGGVSGVAAVIQGVAPNLLAKMGSGLVLASCTQEDSFPNITTWQLLSNSKLFNDACRDGHLLRMQAILGENSVVRREDEGEDPRQKEILTVVNALRDTMEDHGRRLSEMQTAHRDSLGIYSMFTGQDEFEVAGRRYSCVHEIQADRRSPNGVEGQEDDEQSIPSLHDESNEE